jgi:hypothetical protein
VPEPVDIFISHAHADATLAGKLTALLEEWLGSSLSIVLTSDPRRAPGAGETVNEGFVARSVTTAKVFVWLATKSGTTSPACIFEVTTRRNSAPLPEGGEVIPFIVGEKVVLPWPFTHIQFADCANRTSLETALTSIATNLGRSAPQSKRPRSEAALALGDFMSFCKYSLEDKDSLLSRIAALEAERDRVPND